MERTDNKGRLLVGRRLRSWWYMKQTTPTSRDLQHFWFSFISFYSKSPWFWKHFVCHLILKRLFMPLDFEKTFYAIKDETVLMKTSLDIRNASKDHKTLKTLNILWWYKRKLSYQFSLMKLNQLFDYHMPVENLWLEVLILWIFWTKPTNSCNRKKDKTAHKSFSRVLYLQRNQSHYWCKN